MAQNNTASRSLLSRLLDLVLGRGRISDAQLRLLQPMNRQLSRAGYKFYTFAKDRVTPAGMQFLYDAYRRIAPLREFFITRNDDAYYRRQVIRWSLSDNQRRIDDFLSPDGLREAAKTRSLKDIADAGKKDFVSLRSEFKSQGIAVLNSLHNSVMVLKQLCVLDYYGVLRMSDPRLPENNFTMAPQFTAVSRKNAGDFFVDFVNALSLALNVSDWKPTFDFLSALPGFTEANPPGGEDELNAMTFMEFMLSYRMLSDRDLLQPLACIMKADAQYEIKTAMGGKDIVTPYLDGVWQDFRSTVQGMVQEKKLAQLQLLMDKVFDYSDLKPLKFYNQEESELYERKELTGYTHCGPLMYLHAFYTKYLDDEFAKYLEPFGKLAQVSDASVRSECMVLYRDLVDIYKEILKFDQSLDVKFPSGFQLRSMLEKYKGDETAALKLNVAVDDVNAQANSLIRRSKEKLRAFHELIGQLLEDSGRDAPRLVTNWPVLEKKYKAPPAEVFDKMAGHLKYFRLLLDNQTNV